MPSRMERMKRMKFGSQDPAGLGAAACEDWGALLPDAAEDLLGEAEARALELHIAGCPACAAELTEARRGAAWVTLLKGHTPEPSRDLVAGILARTTSAPTLADAGELLPAAVPAWSMPALQPVPGQASLQAGSVRRWMARWFGLDLHAIPALQPRLTMTAAMAFLSVCLTLNLLGISVTQLHAQDLHAIRLQRTVAGKGASLLRSLEGLRVVYRVESRVNGWLIASITPDMAKTRQ